jgi:hypothetical protein
MNFSEIRSVMMPGRTMISVTVTEILTTANVIVMMDT